MSKSCVASRILLAIKLMRVLSFSEAFGSTPVVMLPSTAGHYWERDVVTKLVCQVRPIDALWETNQGCMVASQAESHCSGSEKRGKLKQHAACHYLVGISDCVAAQKEPRTDGVFGLCTELRLSFH